MGERDSRFWVEFFFLLNGTIMMFLGISRNPTDYGLGLVGFFFMLIALILETRVY